MNQKQRTRTYRYGLTYSFQLKRKLVIITAYMVGRKKKIYVIRMKLIDRELWQTIQLRVIEVSEIEILINVSGNVF